MTNIIYTNMWKKLNEYFLCSELISFENELMKDGVDLLEVEKERLCKLIQVENYDINNLRVSISTEYGTKISKFKDKKIKLCKINEDIPHKINVIQNDYVEKQNQDDLIKLNNKYLDFFSKATVIYGKEWVGPSEEDMFKNYINDWYMCAYDFINRPSVALKYNPQNAEKNTFYNYLNVILKEESSRLSISKSLKNREYYDELTSTQKRKLQHIKKAMTNLDLKAETNLNGLNEEKLKKIVNELKSNPDIKGGNYKKYDEIKLLNDWNEIQSIQNVQSLNVLINSDDEKTTLLDTIADDQEFPEFENDNPDMLKTVISKLGNVKAKEKDKGIFCASLFFDYIDGEIKSLQKDDKNEIIRTPAEAFAEIEPEINQLSELFKDNENEYQAITKTIDYFKEKIRNGEAIKKGDFAKSLGIKHQSDINRAFNNIKNLLCKEE